MKYFYLVVLFVCISTTSFAQSYYGSGNYNRIGLQGQVALFDINTSDFNVKQETGVLTGFTTRGRLYNNFGMVYGIDFLSSKVSIETLSSDNSQQVDTEFSTIGAKLNVFLSYNLIDKHLAIDVGPSLLINGKLEVKDSDQETNIVSGYTLLTAGDLQEISRINPFGVIGITGGFEHVRFTVQYHYGFTNILNNLNKQSLSDIDTQASDFKGDASIISGGIVFYL